MASSLLPIRGSAYTFYVSLYSQSDTKLLKANPTLATGDVKVSIDGGTLNNITTLPDAMPASGRQVRVQLSAAEMTGDRIGVVFVDAAGAEWCDLYVEIATAASGADSLSTLTTAQVNTEADTALTDYGALKPAVAGRTLDVSAAGAITVGSIAANAITAASIAADAIGASELATDGVAEIAAAVWAYANRTLTQGAASVVTAVTGTTISAYKGGYFSATLTGLTDFTGWTRIYFTVKRDPLTEADSAAMLQLCVTNPGSALTDGLLYAGGASATKTDGSITVNSTTSITVVVKNAGTALLEADTGAAYDVWVINASGQPVPVSEGGRFVIYPAVTIAAS